MYVTSLLISHSAFGLLPSTLQYPCGDLRNTHASDIVRRQVPHIIVLII